MRPILSTLAIIVFFVGAWATSANSLASEEVWRASRDLREPLARKAVEELVHIDFDQGWDYHVHYVRHSTKLQTLVVSGPRCTDDAILPYIETVKSLRTLVLDSTNVTEEGVVQFKQRRPEVLVLRSQRWAIKQIGSLAREIRLDTRLNDGHPELRALLGDALFKEVKVFYTGNLGQEVEPTVERLTDDQMMPIKYFYTMTDLDLSWSYVTNAGLQYVEECKQLEHLTLPVGLVSDRTLIQCVRGLRRLQTLGIRFPEYAGFPDTARERYHLFQGRLPKVSVTCYALDQLDKEAGRREQ